MVGDRDADAVGGRREVVAGVEQPIAAVLPGDERAFDQMAFPVEVVGEHDAVLADQRAPVVGEAAARGSAWTSPRGSPPARPHSTSAALDLRASWRAPPRSAAASRRSAPSAAAGWPRPRSPRRRRPCGGPPRLRRADRSARDGCAEAWPAGAARCCWCRPSRRDRGRRPRRRRCANRSLRRSSAAWPDRSRAGGVERPAGDQRRAIVDPRPERGGRFAQARSRAHCWPAGR